LCKHQNHMMLIELFLGEIVLCLIILVQLILNTQIIRNPENNFPILLKEMTCQIYVVLFFVIILIFNSKAIGFVPNNLFYCDQNTQQIKVLFLITILLTLPFIKQSLIIQKINYIEFDILLLLSTLASLLLISASDLLAVYVLIEMQSLCFYILASFKRNSVFSSEAGLKYFIFGSIMSCLFLLALGILYGVTGTLNFNDLSILCLFKYPTEFGLMLSISILLITILFLFKLAVVPFHFWAPDVYEGAPLASTIIFSILTKLILTHLFMKWIFVIGYLYLTIQHMLIVCGLASILIGSLLALKQKRLKILVIYSSIAQVGFIILSLSLNNYDGFVYCFFFLIIYILTSILIWGNLTVLQNSNNNYAEFVKQSTDSFFITDLKNLFEYNASWALMFVCIFFSIDFKSGE